MNSATSRCDDRPSPSRGKFSSMKFSRKERQVLRWINPTTRYWYFSTLSNSVLFSFFFNIAVVKGNFKIPLDRFFLRSFCHTGDSMISWNFKKCYSIFVRLGYLSYDKLLGSGNEIDRINSAIVLNRSIDRILRTLRRAKRFLMLEEKSLA